MSPLARYYTASAINFAGFVGLVLTGFVMWGVFLFGTVLGTAALYSYYAIFCPGCGSRVATNGDAAAVTMFPEKHCLKCGRDLSKP